MSTDLPIYAVTFDSREIAGPGAVKWLRRMTLDDARKLVAFAAPTHNGRIVNVETLEVVTDRPTYHATKYDSARDEVIALLSDETEGYGMRDDSTGDVDAPTGYVQLVTIPADADLSLPTPGDWVAELAETYGIAAEDVAGSHIVTHNSQGFVSVETFESEEQAREVFDCLDARYAEWSDEDRDEDSDGVYICPVQGHGYHSL
jgi:hypothetical protein